MHMTIYITEITEKIIMEKLGASYTDVLENRLETVRDTSTIIISKKFELRCNSNFDKTYFLC